MTMLYKPRVKETTTTTGTVQYELAGAETGFQSFITAIGDTNTTWYCCTDGTDWETGVGTIVSGTPNILQRTTVFESSNSNSSVDWGVGTKTIFGIFPTPLLQGIHGDWQRFYSTDNIVSGTRSIAIGSGNIVNGALCLAVGDNHLIVSGAQSAYVFGNQCHVVGTYAQTGGLYLSNGNFNSLGDTQLRISTDYESTSNATEGGLGYFIINGSTQNTGTVLYEISVLARQRGGSAGTVGDSKAWKLQCMISFSAGVLTQVGTTLSTEIAASTGASSWACSINVANNSTGPIRITGEANKYIQWVASITQLENSNGYVYVP